MKKKSYKIKSKVVLWAGEKAAWHFAGVGGKVADELREKYSNFHRGFGSIPIEVKLGKTKWKTSIFWDSKSKGYLLPLKAAVRKAESVMNGEEISFTMTTRV